MMTLRVSLMKTSLSSRRGLVDSVRRYRMRAMWAALATPRGALPQNRYATPTLMTLSEFVMVPRFTGHFVR